MKKMIARAGFLFLAAVLCSVSSYASVPVDASSATVPVTIELKMYNSYEPECIFDIFLWDVTTGEDLIQSLDSHVGDRFQFEMEPGHEYMIDAVAWMPGGYAGFEDYYFSINQWTKPQGGTIWVIGSREEPHCRFVSEVDW